MSIKFSHINIYSKNPETLSHFLTSVFDIASIRNSEGCLSFQIDGIKFLIHLENTVELCTRPLFEINFESIDDVRKIRHKIEFYKYTSKNDSVKILKEFCPAQESIQFIDPDGQCWLVGVDNGSCVNVRSSDKSQLSPEISM